MEARLRSLHGEGNTTTGRQAFKGRNGLTEGLSRDRKITLNTFLIVYLQELRLMASRKLQANELPKISLQGLDQRASWNNTF